MRADEVENDRPSVRAEASGLGFLNSFEVDLAHRELDVPRAIRAAWHQTSCELHEEFTLTRYGARVVMQADVTRNGQTLRSTKGIDTAFEVIVSSSVIESIGALEFTNFRGSRQADRTPEEHR